MALALTSSNTCAYTAAATATRHHAPCINRRSAPWQSLPPNAQPALVPGIITKTSICGHSAVTWALPAQAWPAHLRHASCTGLTIRFARPGRTTLKRDGATAGTQGVHENARHLGAGIFQRQSPSFPHSHILVQQCTPCESTQPHNQRKQLVVPKVTSLY